MILNSLWFFGLIGEVESMQSLVECSNHFLQVFYFVRSYLTLYKACDKAISGYNDYGALIIKRYLCLLCKLLCLGDK